MVTEDLDRVLDRDYLGDLAALDADQLRARRADCQTVEAKLSYLRRLVQGSLDIVSAELERRANGAPAGDLSDLVERLPQILSDRVHGPGPGRLPTNVIPPEDEELTAELEAVTGPDAMARVPDLPKPELEEMAERLGQLERRVSEQRRQVFAVIDAVQEELTSRYEHGEVGTERPG